MHQEKTLIEHFKETDWCGFYVGDAGTIINQTGCKLIKNIIDGQIYVGIEAFNKKYMKKLSTMIYETHTRKGKMPDYMTVSFIDGDPKNCCSTNLKQISKRGFQWENYSAAGRPMMIG